MEWDGGGKGKDIGRMMEVRRGRGGEGETDGEDGGGWMRGEGGHEMERRRRRINM